MQEAREGQLSIMIMRVSLGAANIAKGENLEEKKVLAQKIFGSNLFLSDQKARGNEINQWAALRAAPPSRKIERVKGIEPSSPVWKTGALPLSYTRRVKRFWHVESNSTDTFDCVA